MKNRSSSIGLLFASFALLIIGLTILLPLGGVIFLSITDCDLYSLLQSTNMRYVGLSNYAFLMNSPLFWQSVINTLYCVLLGVPLSFLLALICALLIESSPALIQSFSRKVLFLPVVTTLTSMALVWRSIFNTRLGLMNWVLALLGISPVDWLGDQRFALLTLIFLSVWKNFGYNMMIFLAGLKSIPHSLYEAARLDGAGWWDCFRYISLPMLKPVSVVVIIISLSGYFQFFAEPYLMTSGGPLERTTSLLFLTYQEAFQWWHFGKASALSFLLFSLIILTTASIFWIFNKVTTL